MISMFFSCYKWSLRKIVSIKLIDDSYQFIIFKKNTINEYSISKDHLRSTLKWKGGRPQILMLTIFDGENKIAIIYSGGRQKLENELDEIEFKLRATYKTLPK